MCGFSNKRSISPIVGFSGHSTGSGQNPARMSGKTDDRPLERSSCPIPARRATASRAVHPYPCSKELRLGGLPRLACNDSSTRQNLHVTATRADALSKLNAMVASLMATTSSGSQMCAKYGSDWTKWPGKWGAAQQAYAAAVAEIGQLVDPTEPPPPPPPANPVAVARAFAASLGFNSLNGAVSDDFNGTTLDTAKWGSKTSNQLPTHWTGYANCSLDGASILKIKATRNADATYNSGWLSGTVGYSGTRYVECLAKMPGGLGTWPAPCWEWDFPWGAGGLEDDVVEQLGKDPTGAYNFTVHNWAAGNVQKGMKLGAGGSTLAGTWHRYGAAIYADRIDSYFDAKLMGSIKASDVSMVDFTKYTECMNIDLAMGGWGGSIDPSITEADLFVDYVLVFQP